MRKVVNIGKEHDETVFRVLKEVLTIEGAEEVAYNYGVGGSQEIQVWEFRIGDETLGATAETYVGLSIEGDANTVTRIADAVK